MGALYFDVNNNGVLKVSQNCPDSKVEVTTSSNNYIVSAGDFVMLLNYYKYIKDNDIQNDFINYHGKKKES